MFVQPKMRCVRAKIVLTGQFDWRQLGNNLQPCNTSAFQVEKLKLFLSFYLCRIPENCPGDCHWFCYHGIHWLFRQTHSHSHQQHHRAIAHIYGKWQFLARIIAGLKRTLFKSGVGTPRKIGWDVWPKTINLFMTKMYAISAVIFMTWPKIWYPIYDHCGWHSCLNIINKGLLLMVLSIMMKK